MPSLKQAINDLFDPQMSAEEALDRHFAPSFRQRINGQWIDRAAFLAGIVQSRAVVEHATVTVLEEFEDGARYAERHAIQLVKHDGERIVQEVSVFAQRAPDGRFTRIEETTLMLATQPQPLS